MKFDETNKVIIATLNKPEARAFIKFLISEKKRHLMDIEEADKVIDKVLVMFTLQDWYDGFKENIT